MLNVERYNELRKRGLPAMLVFYTLKQTVGISGLSTYDDLMNRGLVCCLQDNSLTIQKYTVAVRRNLRFGSFAVSQFTQRTR